MLQNSESCKQILTSRNQWEEFSANKFVAEKYGGLSAKSIFVHQSMFVADNYYGYISDAKGTLEELVDAYCEGWQIQAESQTIVFDIADDQEDQNFHSECFDGQILLSQVDIAQGYVLVADNLTKRIDLGSSLDVNESEKFLIDGIHEANYHEQVFEEYNAGLTGFEDQPMMFDMHDDAILSFSSMDVRSEQDVGQVLVNPNIFLSEDVCLNADEPKEVDSYRMDCQIWMADCQNSDFHVLKILKWQIGQRGMHYRVHNDQFLCSEDQITSK